MVHRMVHRLQDRDTLLVGGVFGEAEMTDSGYPRTLREWKRGTAVEEAPLVFEGEASDVSVRGPAEKKLCAMPDLSAVHA